MSKFREGEAFDLELERLDNRKRLGFVFAGGDGDRKFDAIQRSPYPRQSLQTYQGGSSYDAQEPPYRSITQQSWIGGRGQLNLEDDETRFLDSMNLHSFFEGKLFLGGLPTWSTGIDAAMVTSMPGSVSWTRLTGSSLYLAVPFQTNSSPASFAAQYMVYVRAVGNPGNLSGAVYSATGSPGNPNTILISGSFAAADVVGDTMELKVFPGGTLSSSTWYFLVLTNAGADDDNNYWEVGTTTGGASAGRISTNGSSWSNSTTQLYYTVFSSADAAVAGRVQDVLPFIYRDQVYAVVRYVDKSNSFLYMAGYRGMADSNTGNLNTLRDSTQTGWAGDVLTGAVALVVGGPGSEERVPYRDIIGSSSGVASCDPDWLIEHTTSTEYVVLSDTWTSLQDLGAHVTGIALAGRSVYFAFGSDQNIKHWWELNLSGTWTTSYDNDPGITGDLLLGQRSPDGNDYLWVASNHDDAVGQSVNRYQVPVGVGVLRHVIAEVASTSRTWGDYVGSVTQTLEAPDILKFASMGSYTLGTDLVSLDIDPVDITRGDTIYTNLRSVGSTPVVDFYFSDTERADQKAQATRLLHAARPYKLASSVQMIRAAALPAAVVYFDTGATPDFINQANATRGDLGYDVRFTYDAAGDFLYIGYTDQFDSIYFTFHTANTTGSRTMDTPDVWSGKNGWTNVGSPVDGTISGGTSMATNGAVTFTQPDFWTPGSDQNDADLDPTLYWIRLSWNDALSIVQISRIELTNSVRPAVTVQTETLAWLTDADKNSAAVDQRIWRFDTDDWMYVLAGTPFDTLKVTVGATNPQDEVASFGGGGFEYFDGEAFVDVSNLTDGTLSGLDTLKASGDMTWDLPDDMAEVTINGVTGYCVRLQPTSDLTDDFELIEIAVRNSQTFEFYDLDVLQHGEDATLGVIAELLAGDFLYACGQNRFDALDFNLGSVLNNNAVTAAVDYFDGNDWVGASNESDGTTSSNTLDQSGVLQFDTAGELMQQSTVDGTTGYWVRVGWSGAVDPVEFRSIGLQRNKTVSQLFTLSPAGDWNTGALSANLTDDAVDNGIDKHNIRNVTLVISQNKPTTLELRGGLKLARSSGFLVSGFGPQSDRITGLELYGQLRQNPWVFTEGGVYEIQTQNNNDVVPIPLRELSTLRSPANGQVSTTNDTYLYFNLGAHVQRYFNQTLDNIGWTRDEGLPNTRQGLPSFLLSAPGGVYAGVDAGSSGYSSVLFGQSRAWHDIFRAPFGLSVQAATIQSVPGPTLDRLWVSVGGLLMWLPIPSETFDPTHDANFQYSPEGHVITSWMSANLYSLVKLWRSMTVFQNRYKSGDVDTAITTRDPNIDVHVSYQLDYGDWDSGWTRLPEDHDENPIEEVLIAKEFVKARRIRFRLALRTDDANTTPVVNAYIVDALLRFPTKFSYTFQFRVADNDENKLGVRRKTLVASTYVRDELDVWANDMVACRIHCEDPMFDQKLVVIEPISLRPMYDDKAYRGYLCEATLLEV